MSFETVLTSERIYEGHILNLRVDQIRTPNGVEALREIIENNGAVAVVAIDQQNRVVLVNQYRHAVAAVVTEIPAGKLDGAEDPLEGVQRELREETGYRAGQWQVLGKIYPSPAWSTEFVHLYLATDLIAGPTAPEADETIEVIMLPFVEALAQVRAGLITDAKTVAALLLAQAALNS